MPASPGDVTDMLVFARVVEEKSFTAAARKLALSKSVVSSRVAALEERLGVTLLHRTTRKLALTDDGVRFFDRCARVAAEADEAVGAVEEARGAVRGVLRLTAAPGFAQRHLVAPLAGFCARHPDVRLELSATDRLVDLAGERFDLAVRIAARLADPRLVARRLAGDRLLLCASPAYLAARGVPGSPAELVHHVCLRYSRVRTRDEWAFEGPAGALDVSVDGPLAASSGTFLREAALAGQGIAVLPESECAEELAAGRLLPLLDGFLRDAAIAIWAVHPYGAGRGKVPARVRAMVDFLVEWFREPRWGVVTATTSRRSSRSRSASAPR
jgi:DNA-binding transcriptional LysR family regulator